jgi:hypothetical protein
MKHTAVLQSRYHIQVGGHENGVDGKDEWVLVMQGAWPMSQAL